MIPEAGGMETDICAKVVRWLVQDDRREGREVEGSWWISRQVLVWSVWEAKKANVRESVGLKVGRSGVGEADDECWLIAIWREEIV